MSSSTRANPSPCATATLLMDVSCSTRLFSTCDMVEAWIVVPNCTLASNTLCCIRSVSHLLVKKAKENEPSPLDSVYEQTACWPPQWRTLSHEASPPEACSSLTSRRAPCGIGGARLDHPRSLLLSSPALPTP